MNLVPEPDGKYERNDSECQELEELRIVEAFGVVVEHQDEVQNRPYGSDVGAEGVFVTEGGNQVDDQEGAAGSEHAVDDSCSEEYRDGNPCREGRIRLLHEEVLQCNGYDDAAVERNEDGLVHDVVEVNANSHADEHEGNDSEKFLRVDIFAVLHHEQNAYEPADDIYDRFGHIWSVEEDGRRNGEHHAGKSGQGLYYI